MIVGPTERQRISNLRFADDVLLIGKTQQQLTTMLQDIHESVTRYGLELHPDTTKVLSNTTKRTGRGPDKHVFAGNMRIVIFPFSSSLKYLGRRITFDDPMETEIANRFRCGWAKFTSFKQELTSKNYSLRDRLKLFDSVVTPTV